MKFQQDCADCGLARAEARGLCLPCYRFHYKRGTLGNFTKLQAVVCARGHKLEGDNLYVTPGGSRRCRQCTRWRKSLYRRGKHAKGIPA